MWNRGRLRSCEPDYVEESVTDEFTLVNKVMRSQGKEKGPGPESPGPCRGGMDALLCQTA